MRFALFLALRGILHRKLQSLVAVLGVAAGVAVVTTALSLTNGFSAELIRATLKASPHIILLAYDPRNAPPPEDPAIEAKTPFLPVKALLTRRASEGRSAASDFGTLLGVGPGADAVYPELGLSALAPGRAVLGSALAASLGLYPGERFFALAITQKRRDFTLAATFSTGNYVIDAGYGFIPLADAQALLESPGAIAGWHLRIQNPEAAPRVAERLTATGLYWARTWQDLNRTLLEQLALQKKVIGIVLSLIVGVAALGIANVLVLLTVEKTPELALLRALGAGAGTLVLTFMWQGLLLGGTGILLGNLAGYLLSRYFEARPPVLPGELYFITRLPVEIQARDFAWASGVALITVALASLAPLWRILRTHPGKVLR